MHRAAADAAGARLTVQCDNVLRTHAPPGMLTRVIDNLLGNALRYAPGPIELIGQALPPKTPGGKPAGVRIGVLDRGPGVRSPLDALDRAVASTTHPSAPLRWLL